MSVASGSGHSATDQELVRPSSSRFPDDDLLDMRRRINTAVTQASSRAKLLDRISCLNSPGRATHHAGSPG